MIPQTNPRIYYDRYAVEINEAIRRTLESGSYILGKEVASFEEEFAGYLGANHAIGVGSGTDALQLALRCLGVGAGDVVVTVSHTAVATVTAILLAGATPLLIDVDPDTYTMSPDALEAALDVFSKTDIARCGMKIKAVIPVHLYGHPADMRSICSIANQHGLYVLEDCAQATGATLYSQKLGTFGHMAAFSFYPTKNLGALGDGGAVVTNNSDMATTVKKLREYGWQNRVSVLQGGINSRLDELQAAILRTRLNGLDHDNQERLAIANKYSKILIGVQTPVCLPNMKHIYHQYVIRSQQRDRLRDYLQDRGVATAIHYQLPVHKQPAFSNCLAFSGLDVTEALCKQIISLPMYSGLTDDHVQNICQHVNQFAIS
jgi:dTDP-4-amino-4,6-dideoxygalactose transaminase